MTQRTPAQLAALLVDKLTNDTADHSQPLPGGIWVRTLVDSPSDLTAKVPTGTLGYVHSHATSLAFIAFELPLIDIYGEEQVPGDTGEERWLITGFHPHQVEVLDDTAALDAALAVQYPEDRAVILAALAPHLQSGLQREAFEAIATLAALTDIHDRIEILMPLLEALQGNPIHADLYEAAVQDSLNLIPQVSTWDRGFIAGLLAPVVPATVIETLLEVAISIAEDKWRWSVIRDLAAYLTIDQCGRAWAAVKQIDEQWLCYTRKALETRVLELMLGVQVSPEVL